MKSASLSMCGRYRFTLTREWDTQLPRVCFVMLNPSTADADLDDPTIRRCIRFACDWGFGALEVVNLSPVRSTDPDGILGDNWPSPNAFRANRYRISAAAERADLVILGWGAHKAGKLISLTHGLDLPMEKVRVLGTTKDGSPRHPLYVRADTKPEPWL